MAITKLVADSITSGVAGVNTPYFTAYKTSNISIAHNTDTVVVLTTTLKNEGSAYSTSTGKFTPQVAGDYFVFFNHMIRNSGNVVLCESFIKKNGSTTGIQTAAEPAAASTVEKPSLSCSGIVNMNGSTDFLTATVTIYDYTANNAKNIDDIQFGAYKLIS